VAIMALGVLLILGCDDDGATRPCLSGRVLTVRSDGSGQYSTIQAAIDAADSMDVVLLADGIYRGEGNRDIDFNGKAITLRSESANPEDCVIDCEADSLHRHRGFVFDSSEGSFSQLQYITIRNGYASGTGGAVFLEDSSPTISKCSFENNRAAHGGAVSCFGRSFPTFTDCMFSGNSATSTFSWEGKGGGMWSTNASAPRLTRCTFVDNIANSGGGIHAQSYVILDECRFDQNVARHSDSLPGEGGGLCSLDGASVTDCVFEANSAKRGGGIYHEGRGDPHIGGCDFRDNLSAWGAGAYCAAPVTFGNCRFSGNEYLSLIHI